MDNMRQEQEPIPNPEHHPESPRQAAGEVLLSYTQNTLAFVETVQMQLLRQQMVSLEREAEKSEDEFKGHITDYQDLSAQEIDKIQDQNLYPKAQIGLIIASAGIYHTAGRFQNYQEAMEDAITYADNMGYKDVTQGLKEKQLEIFRGDFELGIDEMLEMADFLFDNPKAPDPYSMGFDERAIDELSDDEKAVAQQVIYQKFGLIPESLEEARIKAYSTQAPEDAKVPGEVKVEMFKTNQENLFLQELTFQDGHKSWVIGPDQNI